ncbi:MAG TPA: hypothetical protein VFN42_04595 [Acetobacteraceae bacterium]|nr:hypothetical protein [Acetobacteraceae bacterium]
MNTLSLFGGMLAVMLLLAPGLAAAQNGGATANRPGYARGNANAPTGMTGNYRGWDSARGSGSGANNFVGNGRGQPGTGNPNAGRFGGWFANNHRGQRD